jgi:hypothetical protein
MSPKNSRQRDSRELRTRSGAQVVASAPVTVKYPNIKPGAPIEILRLPPELEATLISIRTDVYYAKQYLDAGNDDPIDEAVVLRLRNREREIVLWVFDKDEIDDVLLDWYVQCVDKYIKIIGRGDGDTCTDIAIKVYVELYQFLLLRRQAKIKKQNHSVARAKSKSLKDGTGL